jgi:hypothetical protein
MIPSRQRDANLTPTCLGVGRSRAWMVQGDVPLRDLLHIEVQQMLRHLCDAQ